LLTLGLFAGGLMSKSMLVTLPVVLLIVDFWPLQRTRANPPTTQTFLTVRQGHAWLGLIFEKLPFAVLSIATSVVTLITQKDTGAFTLELPLDARIGNAIVSVVRYLGKVFWPFELTPFYPHPGYWPWLAIVGSVLCITGLTAVGWSQRHARPWMLTGWLLFLTMLLPVIGLVQVGFQSIADRYTYLPVLGAQLALLWTVRGISTRPAFHWLAGLLVGILLAGCVARTWSQEATWRDPVTLLEHAITVTERNDTAQAFLGYTLLGQNRTDDAALHCERALEINPHNETALFALAGVRTAQGRTEEAIESYRAVLRLRPRDEKTSYALGLLLLWQGHGDEAIRLIKSTANRQPALLRPILQNALEETQASRFQNALVLFELAVELAPNNADAQFGFGFALSRLGRSDEALAHYETALKSQPDHAQAHTEIGLLLLGRNQPAEAIFHFRCAIKNQPNLGVAFVGLGRAAEQMGNTAEASASFEHAVECTPNDPVAQTAWAETLMRRGQFAAAVPHYEQATKLAPNDASAHAGLGYALFFSNRRDNAIAQWEEALRLDPNFRDLQNRLEQLRR
jgi:tetratricopeptide (TPR) repeat protein